MLNSGHWTDRSRHTGDQAGGKTDRHRSTCTTALDGAMEEGQSGQGGEKAVGGGGTRRRRDGGHAEDTEGDGRAGAEEKGGGRAKGRVKMKEGESGWTGKWKDKGGRGTVGTVESEWCCGVVVLVVHP